MSSSHDLIVRSKPSCRSFSKVGLLGIDSAVEPIVASRRHRRCSIARVSVEFDDICIEIGKGKTLRNEMKYNEPNRIVD